MGSKVIKIVGLLALCVSVTGCFAAKAKDIEAFIRPYQVDVTSESYILQPPDEIEIHCKKVPEIDLQRQQIRPDGKIAFEALGEIEVAGKTPQQVADILSKKATELYALSSDKPIDVRVTEFRSKFFYVVGEVNNPGPILYTGRNTLLQALAQARPAVTGWGDHIQVIRPSSDEEVEPKIFEIKYKQMVKYGDTSKNVLLQEGDIVYVPPTPLAAVAMVIEEFTRPIGRALAPVYQVTQIQNVRGY
ncbi:MAG: polysaccharide biosynthesis/export family protein [Dehalococcoidia bacterium]|nr:polysaccharide biosynthesis/export family protein [Dehalococcoidia bacterium]